MKKLISLGASAALLLSVAVPAFAYTPWFQPQKPSTTKAIVVGNEVEVNANSGLNYVSGPATLVTGTAGAEGTQLIVANVSKCNTCRTGSETLSVVKGNELEVSANSGMNKVSGMTQPTKPTFGFGGHHSTTPTSTVVTGNVYATGSQWIVTNVSM